MRHRFAVHAPQPARFLASGLGCRHTLEQDESHQSEQQRHHGQDRCQSIEAPYASRSGQTSARERRARQVDEQAGTGKSLSYLHRARGEQQRDRPTPTSRQ